MRKYYTQRTTKSGYLICLVPMCQTKKSTTTLKTFEIPSDPKRRTQWISAIVDATVQIEEEQSSLEDLYAIENRRMELQVEISNVLGDHSYVCARHFLPEDIVVHPNVCRLATNAVPSVFKNYPIELPRQFFKKLCQTTVNMDSDCNIIELESIFADEDSDDSRHDYVQEETIYETFDAPERGTVMNNDRFANSKLECKGGVSNKSSNFKKKYRSLQTRYKQVRGELLEMRNKLKLYNIACLERDAANNNEEAICLLDMLRSYKVFERTRQEILLSRRNG